MHTILLWLEEGLRLSHPLAVTATHDVGAGGSESAKDLLNSSLPSFGKSTSRQTTD